MTGRWGMAGHLRCLGVSRVVPSKLLSTTLAALALGFSSRSQPAMWWASAFILWLTCSEPSVGVRWRPLLAMVVISHLLLTPVLLTPG